MTSTKTSARPLARTTGRTTDVTSADRTGELRTMLMDRRREIVGDVRTRLRDGRADRSQDVSDSIDVSDAHVQGDLDLALLQMRSETLLRVDEALVRLDAGQYGTCFECSGPIAERRLRALPFAVRCQSCEERREAGQNHERRLAVRRGGAALYSEGAGS
jgi:DnaK suppressor protein